jgi:hypothetical protein
MNLATLYARQGQEGLEKLAKAAGLKVSYLQRLLYVLDRRPSLQRAQLLIDQSKRLFGPKQALTVDGLSAPVYYKDAIQAALAEGTAHASFKLRNRVDPLELAEAAERTTPARKRAA